MQLSFEQRAAGELHWLLLCVITLLGRYRGGCIFAYLYVVVVVFALAFLMLVLSLSLLPLLFLLLLTLVLVLCCCYFCIVSRTWDFLVCI